MTESPNFPQNTKIEVLDSTLFPDKSYIKSLILEIISYTIPKGLESKIISADKKEITVDELVGRYYDNLEAYFYLAQSNYNSLDTDTEIVYSQSSENRDTSHEKSEDNIQSRTSIMEDCKKLVETAKPPNYSIFQERSKCPHSGCKFENIHQEEIDHHFRFTHRNQNGENNPVS